MDKVYIGIDRAGLARAQADRDSHIATIAAQLGVDVEKALSILACGVQWPVKE